MYYDDNIAYYPEKWGLEVVGLLNDPHANYSFDDLYVWQHEDGRLFWTTDSGCSCPGPLEDVRSLDDLVEIVTYADLKKFCAVALGTRWDSDELFWPDAPELTYKVTKLWQKLVS